jgi:ArsR family transcriptional regulator
MLEQLRDGEKSVGQLCDRVGVEQANASQHLSILRNKYLVETRKDGNQIFYRLRDPLVGDVLEAMRRFFLAHMEGALAVLRAEREEHGPRQRKPPRR